MLSLNEHCPFHSVLRIYGPEKYISELLDYNFFLKRDREGKNNKFNIYVFDAELIHLVITRISLHDVINNGSSLLIIDSSSNNTVNHYYQKSTISRIKLVTKNVTDDTFNDLKVTRT